MYIWFWWGTPDGKECLKELDTPGRITANGSDLKKKYDGRAWTGFIWLMAGTSGRMLCTQKGNLMFRKMQGISQLHEGLQDSQAGHQSMSLVIKKCLSINSMKRSCYRNVNNQSVLNRVSEFNDSQSLQCSQQPINGPYLECTKYILYHRAAKYFKSVIWKHGHPDNMVLE